MRSSSLRFRLLRVLAIPLLLGVASIAIASYLSARHEAEEIYDAQLAHFARVLGLLSQHEIEEGDVTEKLIDLHDGKFNTPYEKDFAYRVWLGKDVLMQSDNATSLGPLTQSTGFTDRMMNDRMWRIFILREQNVIVEVAEDYHARMDLIEKVGVSVLLPSLLVFPLLVCVIWFGVRYGIAPLDRLSAQIQSQQPEALQPIPTETLPSEVTSLVGALNRLMQRIEEVIDREKRFTGYAAHELRTPLAALKTQVQVALRSNNAVEQQQLFQDVLPGIDRMARLVEQLLTLVRVQKLEQELDDVDLSILARCMADEAEPLARKRQHTLIAEIQDNIHVKGNASMLEILLRNLLDNAFRHSPPGATVRITLKQEGGVELSVHNTGVALTSEQAKRVFDPFYRVNHDGDGSGLGLAIVNWIAKQHGAAISVNSEENSILVKIIF